MPALAFHNISNQGIGFTNISRERFAQIIRFINEKDFEVFNPECYDLDRITNGVLFIFDDAYKALIENALPIMERYGYKGIIPVITGYVGRTNAWDLGGGNIFHLNWDELRYFSKNGWKIASHTIHHPDLTKLSKGILLKELYHSRLVLEEKIGIKIDTIVYPFGRMNQNVMNMARKAGYKYGFGGLRRADTYKNPLAILRIPVYSIDPLSFIAAKIASKGFLYRCDRLKNRFISRFSLFTVYARRHTYKNL